MQTSAVISRIKTIQAALTAFAAFNINAPLFPSDANVPDGSCYDYVIVGCGTSGSVVATRLVEAGYSVLVLEAGGITNLESLFPGLATYVKRPDVVWNYTAETNAYTGKCRKGRSITLTKVVGGQGAADFMIYSRGNPSDYGKWSKTAKDDSWKWKNMMKYFKKAEFLKDPVILNSPFRKYHGLNGRVNITRDLNDVCDEYIKGFELAGEPVPLDNIGNANLGYSRALFNIDNGVRHWPANAYITPIKENTNLHLSLYSLATKIIIDGHKNAVGIEFQKDGKNITVKAKNEVIISAGSIQSPQLLMLSGIGPKTELKKLNIPIVNDLPVGYNLQNAVGAFITFKTNRTANPEPFNAHKFLSPLVVGYATVKKSSMYPDYETLNFIIDDYYYFLSFCGFTLGFNEDICDKLYELAKNTQLMSTVITNLKNKSKGKVILKSSDPRETPKIKTGYYNNDKDLDVMAEEIQHFMKVVSTPYFKEMGLEFMDPTKNCSSFEQGSKEYWKCYAQCMIANGARYVGTNSMGSVVNTEFCVYGMNKLRVVDESVIPNTISGPINAAIVALAEKASETIISYAKSVEAK